MIPSAAAALTYGAVKVAGYALFAKTLNRWAKSPVRPLRFGLAKTALGLAGGLLYLLVIVPSTPLKGSDAALFIGVMPIRLLVWGIALKLFYGDHLQLRTILLAVVAGTAWSYALDGVMVLIYRVLPGMVMPFC
jgi:hypothetical protein